MSRDYGLGMSILPGDFSTEQTAAGSSISDATQLVADYVIVTSVTSGTGVKLPELNAKEQQVVLNGDAANTLLVYPNTSSVKINNQAAGSPLMLPAGHGAIFIGFNTTNVGAIY